MLLKNLRPDAIPLLELGNETGTGRSGILVLDPQPGTSLPIVSDISELSIGFEMEVGAQENVVDQQSLEPKTPGDFLCLKNDNHFFILQVEQTIRGEIELLKEMWSSRDFHVNLVKFINSEKCLEFQKPSVS